MRIPVHCPWLPGYIDVTQTIVVILTMAGLFLDRPPKYGNQERCGAGTFASSLPTEAPADGTLVSDL